MDTISTDTPTPDGGKIDNEGLPIPPQKKRGNIQNLNPKAKLGKRKLTVEMTLDAIEQGLGTKTKTAALLGVHVVTFERMIRESPRVADAWNKQLRTLGHLVEAAAIKKALQGEYQFSKLMLAKLLPEEYADLLHPKKKVEHAGLNGGDIKVSLGGLPQGIANLAELDEAIGRMLKSSGYMSDEHQGDADPKEVK